jgi:two-component system NtrC family sensor kinase
MTSLGENRRILVIDDNEAIHADFRKIFADGKGGGDIDALEDELFGPVIGSQPKVGDFVIDSANQGQLGYEMARTARTAGNPYSVAFVDMRMPPGWDGIETSLKLWSADPGLQVVLCTAYSDYSWQETIEKLGAGDRFLILKKPFDTAEVRQLALALSVKWSLARQAGMRMDELEQKVTHRTRELSEVNAKLRNEVSERERMELELVRAQKLEALGQLVAGIAHEINNPLGFILANLDYIGDELKRQPKELSASLAEIGDVLRETCGGAQRIRHIVADLKTFCRTDESPPEPMDVEQVLESSLTITRSDLDKVATVKRELGTVPPVLANGSRLGQVFLNLLINACQAMSAANRGTNVVTLRTRMAGDRVAIEVSDTGTGISPETLKKIFDPFFTTKPVGKGTGLGLSICHGIVEAFGGTIEVESEVGKGTTMRVLLRTA